MHRDAHQVGVRAEPAERPGEAPALARHGAVALREAVVVAVVHVQHEVRRVLGARVLAQVGDVRRVRAGPEGHLPRLPHAPGDDAHVRAVSPERQDLVDVRRRTGRAVVVAVGEADIHAHVQAATGAEAEAVEAVELLPGDEHCLAHRERLAIPAAPRLSRQLGRPWTRAAPLMYSLLWCQASPATNLSWLASLRAWPCSSTYTPPFGGFAVSEPPSPTNTRPWPKANDGRRVQPGSDELNLVAIGRHRRGRWPGTRDGGRSPQRERQGGGRRAPRLRVWTWTTPDLNEGWPRQTGDGCPPTPLHDCCRVGNTAPCPHPATPLPGPRGC